MTALFKQHSVKWIETGGITNEKYDQKDDVCRSGRGHTIPDGFQWTVNGQEPVGGPDITYKNGVSTLRAVWEYTVGTPAQVTVSFDTQGHADVPAPVDVKAGSRLEYALTPEDFGMILSNGERLRFNGWCDEDGTAWDTLTVSEDLTLFADWIRLIDDIEITWPVPHVGEQPDMPSAPAGADYHLEGISICDKDYNDVILVENTDPLKLYLNVVKNPGKIDYYLEDDEFGEHVFAGTAKLNGEEIEAVFDDYGDYLRIETSITPLSAEETLPERGTPKRSAPNTADNSHQAFWWILSAAALLGFFTARRVRNR